MEQLSLTSIRLDGGTQPRTAINDEVVQDYAFSMMEGQILPAVTVFYDDVDYWLADGFHRYHAARQICRETIDADIKQGTRRDAVLYSVGTNTTHGLRRTNADKRRAVETLLNDPEWARWSNREIARRCGVDEGYVRKLRELSADSPQIERFVERDGTTYTMNTANIGHSQPQEEETQYTTLKDIFQPLAPTIPFPDEYQADPTPAPLLDGETAYGPYLEGRVQHTPDLVYIPPQIVVPGSWKLPPVEQKHPIEVDAKEQHENHVMRIMGSSESPEWYTPQDIIEYVLKLFGEIDTDPCSNSHEDPNVPAKTIFTKEDNGLSKEWYGKLYLNPPYGTEIGKWIVKLLQEHKDGRVEESISLLPGRIDTSWFQPLYEHLMCNVRGRIQFSNAQYSAPFPSIIVYIGKRKDEFIDVFQKVGPIMRRIA